MKLTESQRTRINTLFKKVLNENDERHAAIRCKHFCDSIDRNLLSAEWSDLFGKFTPAQTIFADNGPLNRLCKAITDLTKDQDTLFTLDQGYCDAYPCPEWANELDAIQGQTKKTALIRPKGKDIEVVHVAELLERIKTATGHLKTRTQGDRSRKREMIFIRHAASIFRSTTGRNANQGELFREIIEVLFDPFDPVKQDYASLIRRALKK